MNTLVSMFIERLYISLSIKQKRLEFEKSKALVMIRPVVRFNLTSVASASTEKMT